jgi:hypothetical protein
LRLGRDLPLAVVEVRYVASSAAPVSRAFCFPAGVSSTVTARRSAHSPWCRTICSSSLLGVSCWRISQISRNGRGAYLMRVPDPETSDPAHLRSRRATDSTARDRTYLAHPLVSAGRVTGERPRSATIPWAPVVTRPGKSPQSGFDPEDVWTAETTGSAAHNAGYGRFRSAVL